MNGVEIGDYLLMHKSVVNNGEVPQYYVENHHPAIVSKDTFERVQLEKKRRNPMLSSYTDKDEFMGKVFCCDCGHTYTVSVKNYKDRPTGIYYQCSHRYKAGGRKNGI